MMQRTCWTRFGLASLVALAFVPASCGDLPPIDEAQTGFRGTGMLLVADQGELEAKVAETGAALPGIGTPPEPGPPAADGTFQNVQVLTDLSAEEFVWFMTAITQWVAPRQGCVYCHVQAEDGSVDMVSDDNYTKIVARRMIQMTRHLNTEWTEHVRDTGVNCYTCHRGQPVPAGVWHYTGRNQSLRHFLDRDDIRVQDLVALAENSDNRSSLKQTEYAYELMLHISKGLGVNCTFCHNTGHFGAWEDNPPQRVTALRGIRMTRDLNLNYFVPLQSTWPAQRLGAMGDGPKMQCSTCHVGAYRPLYGSPASHAPPALLPRPETATPADSAGGAGDGGTLPAAGDGSAEADGGTSGPARDGRDEAADAA